LQKKKSMKNVKRTVKATASRRLQLFGKEFNPLSKTVCCIKKHANLYLFNMKNLENTQKILERDLYAPLSRTLMLKVDATYSVLRLPL